MTCSVCRRQLPAGRRLYCAEKCLRRAAYVRYRPERLAKQVAWRVGNPERVKAYREDYDHRTKADRLAAEKAARAQRRAEMARLRPRCVICSNPLPWHKPSFPLSATTCGPVCARKRIVWFGAQRPRKRRAA